MNLETDRLILRPYKITDFERVHSYGSLPDFSQYDVWGPNTVEDTKKFIKDSIEKNKHTPQYQFEFAICLKDEDLLIGGCGIRRETQTSHIANLGYAISPDFQKNGYATEAAKTLISFGFNKLKLKVIYATCDTRNVSSFAVMEKLGMLRTGHTLKDKRVRGHFRDSYRYEICSHLCN